MQVWMHRQGAGLFSNAHRVTEHAYFSRRGRRLEALWLYRRLLRKGQRVFISTATTTDMLLLNLAVRIAGRRTKSALDHVKLYIHWLYPASGRMRRLKRMARRYPGVAIACPTTHVQHILQECGFTSVQVIPYPSSARRLLDSPRPQQFAKLLYAGAARLDKGFATIVQLVELLQREHHSLPITIQCSPAHKGTHSDAVKLLIDRVTNSGYAYQNLTHETLDKAAYLQLFVGAIVLQPYEAKMFADRVSGVTLDALRLGCPVIAPANTWMAAVIQRFDAGAVIDPDARIQDWYTAIQSVLDHWERYATNAAIAGRILSAEHDPSHLMNWLRQS